ncbi:RNA chaperone ProQ [Catenovulum adriaticum]|uniref:RNA chaperone ProQ n=1 Tax=Catenovulum adriaticum TaxID=2984846 RepID=A0ABY7AI57_9ALTE|nr:RNA chaperone ProQ [Catenovulum sp. TS8]WAJ69290.1 RNA chaperone ProQ [Catenovulum sp. TS8]
MQQTTPENENAVDAATTESQATDTVESATESQKLKAPQEVIAYLSELFPQCFSIKGEAKPLKIGIFQDIAERIDDDEKLSRTVLRSALRKYTSSWRYLASIKEGASRVDIDGNEAGIIEAEHAEHAATSLAQSKQKVAERRKQQRQAEGKKAPQTRKKHAKANPNVKSSQAGRKPIAKPAPKIEKRDPSVPLEAGMKVNVLMGNSPVSCILKEVNGNDVVVETTSGMTIKAEKKQIV